MSTRSGKRIHASVDSSLVDTDLCLQSERKTRSKKQKENVELSVKKKHNYVSYPADEDTAGASNNAVETQEKTSKTGKTRRNTLKELNVDIPVFDNLESNNDNESIRKTRRGKKLLKGLNNTGDLENIQSHEKSEPNANDKKKNKKKKSHKKGSVKTADKQDIKNRAVKTKDIKMTQRFDYIIINGQEVKQIDTGTGDTSVDSYHSAAGSPVNVKLVENCNQTDVAINFIEHETEHNIFTTIIKPADAQIASKSLLDVKVKKRRHSSIKNCTFHKMEIKDVDNGNPSSTPDKTPEVTTASNIILGSATKKKRKSSIKNSTFDNIEKNYGNDDDINETFDKTVDVLTALNTTVDVPSRTRRRSSIKNSVIDNTEVNGQNKNNLNTTFDKVNDTSTTLNTTIDVSTRKKKKSAIKNSTFDKIESNKTIAADDDNFNLTYDHTVAVGSLADSNFSIDNNNALVKLDVVQVIEILNIPNDNVLNSSVHKMSNGKRKSSVMNASINEVKKHMEECEIIDTKGIFHKIDAGPQTSSFHNESLETKSPSERPEIPNDCVVFHKDNIELNTTFDTEKKSEISVDFKKSSLMSTDATINVTFNKSEDSSCINITSDESKTENILNHTPVLIESSINESLMSEDKTPEKSEGPITPLKREGTFTKEVSDFIISPKYKVSPKNTTIKRKSSPGCTPYPYSKSSLKENTKLNVTRSIEKSLRRSSLMEAVPRQTRVMFCSPVNNTSVVAQIKGRVIKSNLKGSNKSFLLEDSGLSEARTGRRKRSFTVGAAGAAGEAETRAKRKRLGDELQHSVDRLSRPRTLSAAAKLPDPGTPSKKFGTPSKAKPESRASRTKLPNFAALHQKQFAKMESLDECQERKAKRARQLLTPSGSVGLLERISPKGTPPKSAPPAKEPAAKLHTPSKPKLPTLESLNPGYTRFGFKLNVDVNPFSVARTAEAGSKDLPNDPSRRTARSALPSLAGATAGRRAAAKQVVMREKSFTGRDAQRDESRTVIKGVRTNRRFELQMRLRNINA